MNKMKTLAFVLWNFQKEIVLSLLLSVRASQKNIHSMLFCSTSQSGQYRIFEAYSIENDTAFRVMYGYLPLKSMSVSMKNGVGLLVLAPPSLRRSRGDHGFLMILHFHDKSYIPKVIHCRKKEVSILSNVALLIINWLLRHPV